MTRSIPQKIARFALLVLLLVVFSGPFWGILATAFNSATVQPGKLLAWPDEFTLKHFSYA